MCVIGFGQIANAATTGVNFNGVVNSTCLLVLLANGTMTASGDLRSLSSKNALGTAGVVSLTTTGGVNLGVDHTVTNVIRPAGDTGTITWSPVFSASGAHNLAESPATRPLIGSGISQVSVHLTGTKGVGDVFTVGNYQATVTLRCEP